MATTCLAILALQGLLAAQDSAPRLLDCVEAPYAYVALDAGPGAGVVPGGGVVAGGVASHAAGAGGQHGPSAVHTLLADPSLDALFRFGSEPSASSSSASSSSGSSSSGSSSALSLVRGMLRRGGGEFELAMTGIVGRGGQPLLVMRARLQRDDAQKLQLMLDAEAGMAMPHRRIGDRQTYVLREQAGSSGAFAPGEGVELALCGNDLIVGNDGSAMREVLIPRAEQVTAAVGTRRVLSADPRFLGLRRRANVQPGSLLVFGDWERLGRRLQSTMQGAPAQLLGSSGLDSARAMMMTLSPLGSGTGADAGFCASMQFDFASDAGGASAGRTGVTAPVSAARSAGHGIDGWFAATESVEAKTLLRELPHGGLGGLVLSVDLAAIASSSPRSSHLVWDLRDAFDSFGLDFDRNVLGRLGRRGTVQLSFGGQVAGGANGSTDAAGSGAGGPGSGDSDAAIVGLAPAWTLRAVSRKAASDLFSDLRRVVEAEGLGKLVDVRDPRGKRLDVLAIGGEHHHFTAFAALANDSLLLAEEAGTLVQLLEDSRSSRPRRRDQLVANALQAIGREQVAGLFDLDLEPLFTRIAEAVPGIDLSALPRRHAGTIDIDRNAEGSVVRIQVVSSR